MSKFHATDGVFFERLLDGSVRIIKTERVETIDPATHADSYSLSVVWEYCINSYTWSSIVLSMSAFGERPHDWAEFLNYHTGHKDIFSDIHQPLPTKEPQS